MTENVKKSAKDTYLSLEINNEIFAISITRVLEVLQKQKITPVPNSPDFIRGIINFRGEIVPVFDTRKKFNLPERDADAKYVIIVLELLRNSSKKIIGAIADEVIDVIRVLETDIKPVPEMSRTFNSEFLLGISRIKDQFLMLLNIDKIFTDEQVSSLYETIDEIKQSI